jgi:hypothetical protein
MPPDQSQTTHAPAVTAPLEHIDEQHVDLRLSTSDLFDWQPAAPAPPLFPMSPSVRGGRCVLLV